MIPWVAFAIQNVLLPLGISYGVLVVDQLWHGKVEFNRAFARSVSLGVDSKKHPDKVTLEALFIASEAELEYACGLVNKDFNKVKVDVAWEIDVQLHKEGLGPDPDTSWNYLV